MSTILEGITSPATADLLVSQSTSDDAAVLRRSDTEALVFTTDFITPLVDDPYVYGQIAAANAISDVFAMGGQPLMALNICCFPHKGVPHEVLNAVLKGGAAMAEACGCLTVGGHTVRDEELKYGLAVIGVVHPDKLRRNSTARVGDALVLTKPLGTGVLIHSAKKKLCDERLLEVACRSMLLPNKAGMEVAREADVSAMTDITGFGLAGHGYEMARGAGVGLRFAVSKLPALEGALGLFRQDIRSGMTLSNRETVGAALRADTVGAEYLELACDPQTSGGLLMAVAADQAEDVVKELREKGTTEAAVVGEVFASDSPCIELTP